MVIEISKMTSRIKSRGNTGGREKNHFTIHVKLFTNEKFPLKNIVGDMKISELKKYMEFATGIPIHMQRVSYLDEGELLNHTDVRSNDIVPGATLHLRVWPMWKEIIEAAASNDADWVFSLGVTYPTDYKTPHSDYMTKRARKAWIEERAFLALYIAAHRGYQGLVKKLIDAGADVNASTPFGRTALHVAAAQGRGNIVDALLERGADIDAEDEEGESALSIAAKFNHKSCERHLFLFRWQERAKRTNPSEEPDRMAHQFFDSAFPVWLKGGQCQMYYTNILPPGEFGGSRFNSPKRRPHTTAVTKERLHSDGADQFEDDEMDYDYTEDGVNVRLPAIREERRKARTATGRKRAFSYDQWLARKQSIEQRAIDIKKAAEERKRLEEEAA
ncbi:hypothetical protein KUTeg_019387 [Tegillarca granosa]|uniref:Ubiquitin-like domain-containing protein n=1 Tax=Tegillarca granosa TaxID=220873 RepID=A0ABQ9ECC0_TEGGR|nr:hypothetical protein KUTeg_019387 [Tegillarca granosa]